MYGSAWEAVEAVLLSWSITHALACGFVSFVLAPWAIDAAPWYAPGGRRALLLASSRRLLSKQYSSLNLLRLSALQQL